MNSRRNLLKKLGASVPAWALTKYVNAADRIMNSPPGGQAATGVDWQIADTRLRIHFVTDQIVRVTATRNPGWSNADSLMRIPVMEKPGPIERSTSGEVLVLRSSKLAAKLNLGTGAISFWRADGELLLEEDNHTPRTFSPVAVVKSMPDPASMRRVKTVDGERQVAGAYVQKKDRDAWRATARFRLHDEEALYGLGFDETDDLNLRGKRKRLYQHNLRIVNPFLVSTRGYGLLFDAYSASTFADGPDGMSMSSDVVDELDYYFVLGHSMDGAIAGYRQLTGAATLLPKWAFGYMQSRERYVTQDELIDTARQFRTRRIPLDTIVQDWNYWVPNHWGSFVPDKTRYPDIGVMTKAVHDMNARVMISIWPNPSPLDPPGKALKENGFTLAGTDFVDFFQPKAGAMYFDNAWKYLGRHGIDAWWCDSTEPDVADWVTQSTRAVNADELNIAGLSKIIDPQLLNAYALADSKSLYRNWRKATPDRRLVNLTRSGYAGSQAVGAVVWTGDISAKWSVFAQQVAALLSYSASGAPYVTCDIGGFFVRRGKQWFWNGDYDGGVADLGYRELYTRWLQFGVFLPMFRSHGTDTPREPWHFGEPGTAFYDAILDSIQLRYRLLPHIYSQAGLVHLHGASFIRPLAFRFPEDPRTYDLKTQMLFGDGMMVSPVLEPMYYGVKSAPINAVPRAREVYLPKGLWIDFWTGQRHSGGRTIMVDAPLSRMPIHVRAGSVIPMGPSIQYSSEMADAPIELRVYPGADDSYTYYEDAGDGWGYERGEYALMHMRWDDAAGVLTISNRQGHFPSMRNQRRFQITVVGSKRGRGHEFPGTSAIDIVYDGREVAVSTGSRS